MFNRKKHEIARLNAALSDKRTDYLEKARECEFYREQADALRTERDELMKANDQIKRDLETEGRQKEDLAALLADAQKQIEDQRHTIETQQNEAHALYEKMSASPVRPACPSDCVKHDNPGPGASACRNCTRNPHAVDKYRKEETA